MIHRQKRYARRPTPFELQRLEAQWQENAEAGNICTDHHHPEPCPTCREEMAAERAYEERKERGKDWA